MGPACQDSCGWRALVPFLLYCVIEVSNCTGEICAPYELQSVNRVQREKYSRTSKIFEYRVTYYFVIYPSTKCALSPRAASMLASRTSGTIALRATVAHVVSGSAAVAPFGTSSRKSTTGSSAALGAFAEIQQANERHAGRVEIRYTLQRGWGVYAVTDFASESLLFSGASLQISRRQSSHTIQTASTSHVVMDLPARLTNHVCNAANMGVKVPTANCPGTAVYNFFAKRDIRAGDELRWDYETTEYSLSEPLLCTCGAPQCRGVLRGFRHHADLVIAEHGLNWVAPYLLQTQNCEDDRKAP